MRSLIATEIVDRLYRRGSSSALFSWYFTIPAPTLSIVIKGSVGLEMRQSQRIALAAQSQERTAIDMENFMGFLEAGINLDNNMRVCQVI